MDLSNSNKALIGLLLAVLLTWGGRTYFYTRHLKTEAQVEERVKAVRLEETVKRSEILEQKGQAYKEIETLRRELTTAKTSKGTKQTLPNGTVNESWDNTENTNLVEQEARELQSQLLQMSVTLEESRTKVSEAEDRERKLKESFSETVTEKKSFQKRFTLLAGMSVSHGTWQERLKLGGLLHLGALSVGLSASPVSTFDEMTKPTEQREDNGWIKGLAPVVWGGLSF